MLSHTVWYHTKLYVRLGHGEIIPKSYSVKCQQWSDCYLSIRQIYSLHIVRDNITMKLFLLINISLMQNIQYWISTSPSQTSFDGYDLYLKGVKIIKFVMINYDFYS